MKTLKSVLIIIFFLSISSVIFGQEDSTEVKNNGAEDVETSVDAEKLKINTENLKISIENLQIGIFDFRSKISKLENENKLLKDSILIKEKQIQTTENDDEIEKLEEQIEQYEEKIEQNKEKIDAFEEGIEGINDEIDELLDNIEDLNEELTDMDLSKKRRRKKEFRGHWAGLEFGINNYLNKDFQMSLPAGGEFMDLWANKSFSFSFNFLQYSLPLFSRHVGLVTGTGVEWNNYRLKRNINLFEEANGVINFAEVTDINYHKNILRTIYFNVPLLIEFQIPVNKKDRRINIGFGAIGGIKIGSKFKKVWYKDGQKQKIKTKDDYQISLFRYSATFRIGYRALQLFTNYNFSTLFEKNMGPELYPVTAGIRLNF